MSGGWDDRDRFYVKLTRATLAHMKMKTPGVGTLHRHLPLSSIDCTVNTDLTEEATSYYKFGGIQFGHALSEYCTVKGMCYICPRSVAKSHSICGRAESSRV
jgi:hypothetical protein